MRNERGISLLGTIVVIAVILFSIFILLPAFQVPVKMAPRLVCATNLKGLSAAIYVYAFDYEDATPVLGWQGSEWGFTTRDWDEKERDFSLEGGTVTIASSLYLLVREADVSPKSFVCYESDETIFENQTSLDDVELWDFGANPKEHVSYSYQWPYGEHPASITGPAGKAMMADRNPWFDEKLVPGNVNEKNYLKMVSLIDLAKELESQANIKTGNSQPHERGGQNVLFADGHVSFQQRPDCGVQNDNIYTIAGATKTEKRVGTAPLGTEFDAFNRNDSLLVNDR